MLGEFENSTRDNKMESLLSPGRNCWCIEEASRLSVLVDTAEYFSAFAEACRQARKQILILGWDFDRQVRLIRDRNETEATVEVGAFLVDLVRKRKELQVYLLSWDYNMIYAVEREFLSALRLRLQAPPRFHFRLDGHHPKGASQHQKVVVVDDRVAFVGGVDLSRWRWDTPDHQADDPRRVDPGGKSYPPYHDLMMLVEGPVAARLGELARDRWRRARGRKIEPVSEGGASPWPASVEADLHEVQVAVSRTMPEYRGRPPIEEVKHLYLEAIAAARSFIYIENQYFTARSLANALTRRLEEVNGPEVVLVLPQHTGGWLEQVTMDVLRGRVLERMRRADKYHRLRVYYPHLPGLGEDCLSVHSKLLVVDDRLLRIGSSNTSNRSLGLDSECDLTLEADRHGGRIQNCIAALRRRLLAEHLGCEAHEIEGMEQNTDGLIAVIENLHNDDGRSMRLLDWSVSESLDAQIPGDELVDPSEPFSPEHFVARYVPEDNRTVGRRRLVKFLVVIVVLLLLGAAWRWTPLRDWLHPGRLAGMIDSILPPWWRSTVVIGGIVFSGWSAFIYLLAGSLLSASFAFLAGRHLGRGFLVQYGDSRLGHLSRRLAENGILAVAVLRLVPVAPFTIFNLVAGSSHLSFRQFMLGSLLGMAPGLGAITFFSDSLWQTLLSPSLEEVVLTVLFGLGLIGFVWLAKNWLRSG